MAVQEELRNLWKTSQEACVSITFFFHLNILVFQTNGKQPYSFPVLSPFCSGLCRLTMQVVGFSVVSLPGFLQLMALIVVALLISGLKSLKNCKATQASSLFLLKWKKHYFKPISVHIFLRLFSKRIYWQSTARKQFLQLKLKRFQNTRYYFFACIKREECHVLSNDLLDLG